MVTQAVVTGAGSGIGQALARRLRERGADVVLADIHRADLDRLAAEIGGTSVPTDVADLSAVRSLAAAAPDADLVCLNAGIVGTLGAPWEIAPADWDAVFAVNLGGVVNGLRAFVPPMLASGRPGHILITASLAGLASFPGNGAYGPSKHAVVAVAEQAALALRDTAIGVTVLCPALVRTGMSDVGADPLDVADEALAAVDGGVFLVTDPSWQRAVVARSVALIAGEQPVSPMPTPDQ
jgi:NAD(P)-dependent dehydrogenase (short-subunit alcohol dehydrogenase family)